MRDSLTARHRLRPRHRASRLPLLLAGGLLAASAFALAAPTAASAAVHSRGWWGSTVYTETNQTSGNEVLAFHALSNGSLVQFASYPTGGTGTGASPNSQGAVTLGDGGRLLAVVNGGSDNVTVFSVNSNGTLCWLDTSSSGGVDPISVTVDGGWIYALNAGSTTPTVAPNLGGFDVWWHSGPVTQTLSSGAMSPEEIAASPNGRDLVVTEKGSGTIDVFSLGANGSIGVPTTTTLTGTTGPYGFSFLPNGNLVVSEAAFGGLGTFSIGWNGSLTQLSQVADGQMAPCWTALADNGHEVFTTNAHSGTISAYWIGWNGALTLIAPAVQASPGGGDTDIAVASNGVLYTIVQPAPVVTASWLLPWGGLGTTSTAASGFPAGTFGLAAS